MAVCLGIDPDSEYVALAAGSLRNILGIYSYKIPRPDKNNFNPFLQALRYHIPLFVKSLNLDPIWPVNIIIEGQRIYQKQKVRPNDILHLGQIAGAVAMICAELYPHQRIIIPEPFDWKGNIDKATHQARLYNELGWGYKKIGKKYAYPLHPTIGQDLNKGEWKHVGDAIGLYRWGCTQLDLS